MSFYRYVALDASGAIRAGQLEVAARDAALDALHKRGLVPVHVIEDNARAQPTSAVFRAKPTRTQSASAVTRAKTALAALVARNRLSLQQIVALTHSLAALLRAGLTVDRALAIAASLETTPAAARFFGDLGHAVRAGASFSHALHATGVSLPSYYSSMVEAGELGGSLPQTLTRVAELLQKNLDVRERIQSALIYPIILACVVLGTLVILIVVVLPRFQTLFAESEVQLPWATRIVLALGQFASDYAWLIAGVVAGALIAARTYARSRSGRQRIDQWFLRSRLSFGVPAAIDTARMLRTLSTLLQNGVPLSAALRVSQGTLGNACLRSALERVIRSVNAGEDFSAAMAATQVFPSEAVQLARVGEETGRLHELLPEAAAILEASAARTLERMLAMMVPAITIFMGLLVAGLIGSVLIGLLSLNELAS
jgi:general secretion pathway protein F